MIYQFVILDSARRELEALPHHVRRQINARILALVENPHPSGAKTLKGIHKGLFRVRSGDYRIVYKIEHSQLVIVIVKIGNRKDVYD